jgi:hypothetical protein
MQQLQNKVTDSYYFTQEEESYESSGIPGATSSVFTSIYLGVKTYKVSISQCRAAHWLMHTFDLAQRFFDSL